MFSTRALRSWFAPERTGAQVFSLESGGPARVAQVVVGEQENRVKHRSASMCPCLYAFALGNAIWKSYSSYVWHGLAVLCC